MSEPDSGPSPVGEFSVLLPVYAGDRAAFLRRAFDSATREQELRPAEVVVVRDGPVADDVARELDAIAASSGDHGVAVRVVELAANVGLARALEAGLAQCSYDIVARADADDVSLPHRFAVQVALVRGGADLVGSAITEFEGDEDVRGRVRTPPLEAPDIARYARLHSPFNHPSVVYRRSSVAAAGGYRDLPLLEDYWLFARMIASGAQVRNVAEPLVLYRVGAGAYARRGGTRLLRSELTLQRHLRDEGFTSRGQYVRNVLVRGAYRLVPERVRRASYRRLVVGRQP